MIQSKDYGEMYRMLQKKYPEKEETDIFGCIEKEIRRDGFFLDFLPLKNGMLFQTEYTEKGALILLNEDHPYCASVFLPYAHPGKVGREKLNKSGSVLAMTIAALAMAQQNLDPETMGLVNNKISDDLRCGILGRRQDDSDRRNKKAQETIKVFEYRIHEDLRILAFPVSSESGRTCYDLHIQTPSEILYLVNCRDLNFENDDFRQTIADTMLSRVVRRISDGYHGETDSSGISASDYIRLKTFLCAKKWEAKELTATKTCQKGNDRYTLSVPPLYPGNASESGAPTSDFFYAREKESALEWFNQSSES